MTSQLVVVDEASENSAFVYRLGFEKIIVYQKSIHTPISMIKSLLEKEYMYQGDVACVSFNKIYPNINEQGKQKLLLHFHYNLLDKLDLAYFNACAKISK